MDSRHNTTNLAPTYDHASGLGCHELDRARAERMTTNLAPTYDHASGLGCHELDRARAERMTTRDAGYNVEAFVKKAKSAFYDKNLKKPQND